ncbi:NAD(P)H-binding protein [Pseudonocardia sp. GCM10023141]|uniref:NAD(P)H-binding protein n=1 Tax=Pseudonocardia sp. GCM10023141 TaxID=3252653 RepID=UPI00360C4493
MILITGATGTIGTESARLLAEHGTPFRVLARDPSRVAPREPGEVVRGDFDDAASLRSAMTGIDAVLLIVPFGRAMAAHDRAVVDAARAAGVGRIVKLSALGTGETDDPADARSRHTAGEQAVRDSGAAWTLLRPSGFASNTLGWAAMIRDGQPVPDMTGGGALGIVDPRDVAAVAVAVLTSEGHVGAVYTLTGPEPLSTPAQAAILATGLGRPVTTVDVEPAAAAEGMRAAGVDAVTVAMVERGWSLVREGGGAAVTGDVELVLGRAPRTFATWVDDHREAFADG